MPRLVAEEFLPAERKRLIAEEWGEAAPQVIENYRSVVRARALDRLFEQVKHLLNRYVSRAHSTWEDGGETVTYSLTLPDPGGVPAQRPACCNCPFWEHPARGRPRLVRQQPHKRVCCHGVRATRPPESFVCGEHPQLESLFDSLYTPWGGDNE